MSYAPGIASVQDAVVAILSVAGLDAPVDLGYPAGGVQAAHVWVAGDAECRYEPLDCVPEHRSEDGTLTVHVLVSRVSRELSAVRDAALELAGQVEQALAADITLGGVVDWSRVVSVRGEEAAPEERTRQYGVTLALAYRRLTSR